MESKDFIKFIGNFAVYNKDSKSSLCIIKGYNDLKVFIRIGTNKNLEGVDPSDLIILNDEYTKIV